ncbi:hypothetical protein AX15_005065 [Amanita polypyramis BW_CC]|nr:hypothetical protein AX15_005065 [Amanita polypyramis BW_CC]
MYPLPQPQRAKRRQVKNACTNCQKACKKCDDARPCLRCVKYGIQEACVSSQRKERKKGVKRGPYKKRESKDLTSSPHDSAPHQAAHIVHPMVPPATAIIPSYMSIGLPPPYYTSHSMSKSTEPPPLCPPYLFTQLPPSPMHLPHNGQDGVCHSYPPSAPYYSATWMAQFPPSIYAQYPIPRQEAQMIHQNPHYVYGPQACSKQTGEPGRNGPDHGGSPRGSG